jgi:hypothetical protein
MKKAFIIYWTWYILVLVTMMNVSNLTENEAKLLVVLDWLSYAFLGIAPMYVMFIYQDVQSKVDMQYMGGCLVAFIIRTVLTVFSIYGFQDKWPILAISGVMMLLYYVMGKDLFLKKDSKFKF